MVHSKMVAYVVKITMLLIPRCRRRKPEEIGNFSFGVVVTS